MSTTIYTYPQNPRAAKALIAAKYTGVTIDVPAFEFSPVNKPVELLNANPFGKVPAAMTPQGPLFESNSIARYVARAAGSKIYGSDAYEASVIDQWLDFATNEVESAAAAWLYPIMGFVPFNAKDTQKAKENLKKTLTTLNTHLQSRSFLVGPRVSLADIVLACSLKSFYTMVFDPSFRSTFPNVNRWFVTCVNQPNFKSVLGEVVLTAVMMEPKKEEKKPKEEKPAPPKKEEKPAPAPAAADEEADDKPKKVHPLSLLPPSKFNLEEWKRMYSNNDTRSVALPWFWENYDAEGFSVYFATYKYNSELGAQFMTSNLIGGMFQRLETLHKWAFASVLITGEDVEGKINNQEVTGIWIFRGADLPEDLKECDDSIVYDWKLLDVKDPATKTLIDDYFAWDGALGGRKFIQGKLYKIRTNKQDALSMNITIFLIR
ncbi:glutathione S-transferase domain-containing protein [Heterostelium album PN500]|uniref:Glutathione S-transferase domain-containing protein n=1 Tax=Heterostelium pallidum (strain ATCC 26659 / Pp 5 / PN500) TaxID=670386 RepID=D3BFU2_HETP5|nr:glutathione S-transferase domain-containing protein [Heterostelium album PN500]EFA79702.1 glutathione S-transferase domain-containing protein [Heterostelium album PN500]|eukprot:XP_020431823.1 glutathione S-transferase domain-containing protein [Heterostelium album PN500]